MRTRVAPEQRFDSVENPCPICGGGHDLHGEGRCYGFTMESGTAVICTVVESEQPVPDADGWLHEIGEEIVPTVNVNGAAPNESGNAPLTVKQLAAEKRLTVATLRALGCRNVSTGVLIGGKIRHRGKPKYTWVEGRSPDTDALCPMPANEIEPRALITTGETDMLTARHAGFAAYAITSGEKRSKPSLTSAHFRDLVKRGLEEAVIVGDGDEHGIDALHQMARAAQGAGLRVSVVDFSPLYDHFGAGVKDLNELWQSLDCDVDEFRREVDAHTREYAQASVYALPEIRKLAAQRIEFLVENLISPGEKAGITGPPKSLKTWIALNLSATVACGGHFLGRAEWECREPRPVLFVEEEGDLFKFSQRIDRAFKDIEHAPFRLIPKMGFSLLDRAQVDWLIDRVLEQDAGLLVLDPWQRLIVGADEDKAKETGPAWDEVHRITLECPRCAVVIIHHANKAGGLTLNAIRGSSRFAGEVDLSLIVKPDTPGFLQAALEGRDLPRHLVEDGVLEISYPIDDPFALNATGFTANVHTPGPPSMEQEVAALFEANPDAQYSKTDTARHTGMSNSTVGKHVDALVEKGILAKEGRKFRLNKGASS